MHTFQIKIGNLNANVQANHAYIKTICEPYLSAERSNCSVCIDAKAIDREREISQGIDLDSDCESNCSADWFLEVYALLHKLLPILPEHNMLFLHGSAIEYKGKAYIFVASSGTGKSTHTRLWKERFGDEVTVINDDKPFLAFREDKVYLCGTPWRGKHNIGQNMEVELAAICLLSRGDADEIHAVEPFDAVQDIILQSSLHRYKENALLALDLIDNLLKIVPVYRLSCTPTLNAADVCHNMIIK